MDLVKLLSLLKTHSQAKMAPDIGLTTWTCFENEAADDLTKHRSIRPHEWGLLLTLLGE